MIKYSLSSKYITKNKNALKSNVVRNAKQCKKSIKKAPAFGALSIYSLSIFKSYLIFSDCSYKIAHYDYWGKQQQT